MCFCLVDRFSETVRAMFIIKVTISFFLIFSLAIVVSLYVDARVWVFGCMGVDIGGRLGVSINETKKTKNKERECIEI